MSKNAPRWVIGESDSSEPDDPYKRLMFSVLLDAICKSIMTNDPESNRVLQSPAAMAGMIEAREWLMDPTDADLSRNFYLLGLSISKEGLLEVLRHLWRLRQKDMMSTIRKHAETARAGIARGSGRAANNGGAINAARKHNRNRKLCKIASEVLKESNRWVGV